MEAQLYCRKCGRGHRVIVIAMSTPACTAEISVECGAGGCLELPEPTPYKTFGPALERALGDLG